MVVLAFMGWLVSVKRHNVTLVDTLWAMFFLTSAVMTFVLFSGQTTRAWLLLSLVTLWSLRLSTYLHLRNHNKPEDLRYQAIRERNEPNFKFKSLYLVFLLQAVLAWIISAPIHVGMLATSALNIADYIGLGLWVIGMFFQVTGDTQLMKFKSLPTNKNKVLNTGVWRYTRHPNYFGEACIWFGYGLIAIGANAWWTIFSPIFMTFLLIKITGVKLLEADIAKRRPDYQQYMRNTNTFIPWLPKK